MEDHLGEALIRWSIRLAVACYLARLFVDVRFCGRRGWGHHAKQARWFWTVGCVLYVVHVYCSFAFRHHWSHASAYDLTAEQTAALTGIRWGGGLYINYAFTALWLADTLAWWMQGIRFPYERPRYFWGLHGVFAFIVLNATVVFGPPFWRWIGILVACLMFFLVRSRGVTTSTRDQQRSVK